MSAPFISFLPALGPSLSSLYDSNRLPSQQTQTSSSPSALSNTIPQIFLDAMTVRISVFVDEQSVPLPAEFDSDDPRSFHWVAYASVSSPSSSTDESAHAPPLNPATSSASVPIAAVRLVPPPHPPDPYTDAPVPQEPFCKIGRLCTLKAYRGLGLGRMLMHAVMDWAAGHASEVMGLEGAGRSEAEVVLEREKLRLGRTASSSDRMGSGGTGLGEEEEKGREWNGLVLVHAQTDVKQWYLKMGFEVDEAMGEWDEEGISHVGMLKRLQLKS